MGRILLLHPTPDGPTPRSQETAAPARSKTAFPWLATLISLLAILTPHAIFMGHEFRNSYGAGLGVIFNSTNSRSEDYLYQNVVLFQTLLSQIIERYSAEDVDRWMMWSWGLGFLVALLVALGTWRYVGGSARPRRSKGDSIARSPAIKGFAVVLGATSLVALLPVVLAAIAGYGFLVPGRIAEVAGRLRAQVVRDRLATADSAFKYPAAILDGPNLLASHSLIVECAGECLLFDRSKQQFLVVRADQVVRQEGARRDDNTKAVAHIAPHGPPM